MPILTAAMKRMLDEQRLGFVATVCPDGTPNLSPKGTTIAWDDDHLIFADIHSPGTVLNLRTTPISKSMWSIHSLAKAIGLKEPPRS